MPHEPFAGHRVDQLAEQVLARRGADRAARVASSGTHAADVALEPVADRHRSQRSARSAKRDLRSRLAGLLAIGPSGSLLGWRPGGNDGRRGDTDARSTSAASIRRFRLCGLYHRRRRSLVARLRRRGSAPRRPARRSRWARPSRRSRASSANIGGDRVKITGIVPEGTNSHTFEPKPSVAELLSGRRPLRQRPQARGADEGARAGEPRRRRRDRRARHEGDRPRRVHLRLLVPEVGRQAQPAPLDRPALRAEVRGDRARHARAGGSRRTRRTSPRTTTSFERRSTRSTRRCARRSPRSRARSASC